MFHLNLIRDPLSAVQSLATPYLVAFINPFVGKIKIKISVKIGLAAKLASVLLENALLMSFEVFVVIRC